MASTEELLSKVAQNLAETGRMTPHRSRSLGMQYVSMAMTWCKKGKVAEAQRVLRKAVASDFIPEGKLVPLLFYARASRLKLASKIVQLALFPFVHQDFFVPWWTPQGRKGLKHLNGWEDQETESCP